MAFPETVGGSVPEQPAPFPPPPMLFRPADGVVERLTAALDGLYDVIDADVSVESRFGRAILLRGRLLQDSEGAYPQMVERLRPLGFTPLLRRRANMEVLIIVEGVIRPRTFNSPGWLHALLLILTIFTTTASAAQFHGIALNSVLRAISRGDWSQVGTVIRLGAPFALILLLILGVHEMGHYFAGRRHKISVTLPYFIPMPFFLLGTLGAVIFIKSPLNNRKQLFDVGISGPLAGFVVALIAFIISLFLQPSPRPNLLFISAFGNEQIGMPLLLQGLGELLRPDVANLSRFVSRQPVALAAWFGMLLTVLNLMPIGQLDGGHVMYALFGEFAWKIAFATFVIMIVLGLTVFPSLIFFTFLALLTGLRHPPPGDDFTLLDKPRRYLGYATIGLFFLIATATPFAI